MSQDPFGNLSPVVADTAFALSRATGTGTLGGSLTGTILNGTSSIVVSGVTYTKAESGVSITATVTSGDSLAAGTSATFTVIPGVADHLAITAINPASPSVGNAFSVTVQAQDPNNNPAPVVSTTGIGLTLASGTGNLGGTLTGSITAGTSSVVISGVTYDVIEGGVSITATATSGDSLTPVTSATFAVVGSPTVTSTSPSALARGASNQTVLINGTNFQAGATVTFSAAGVTNGASTFIDPTQLSVSVSVSAGATLGAGNVTVTNLDTGTGTGTGVFTVNPVPTVTSAAPNTGAQGASGLAVVITGTGFQAGAIASFSAAGVSVVTTGFTDSSHLTATINISGSATTGLGNITVTNPDFGVGTGTNVFTVTGLKTWTGTTNTVWATGTNWSPAGAPGSLDDVVIPSGPVNQPVIGAAPGTIRSLTVNSGASLTINAGLHPDPQQREHRRRHDHQRRHAHPDRHASPSAPARPTPTPRTAGPSRPRRGIRRRP